MSRAETVHHQTEGNPLFVQEVLRYLVEVHAGWLAGSSNHLGHGGGFGAQLRCRFTHAFFRQSHPRDLVRALTYDEVAAQQAMRVFAYGESARHACQDREGDQGGRKFTRRRTGPIYRSDRIIVVSEESRS